MTIFNEIYWATRLSALHDAFEVMCLISFLSSIVVTFFYFIALCNDDEEIYSRFKTIIIVSTIVFCTSVIGVVFTPTQKDLALIFGWEALKSDTAKEVFDIVRDQVIGK